MQSLTRLLLSMRVIQEHVCRGADCTLLGYLPCLGWHMVPVLEVKVQHDGRTVMHCG